MPTLSPLLIGAARPRVELAPPSSGSLGDVAVALSTRAGLTPEPWQANGLRVMMSTRPDGQWAAYEYAEWVARQQGKTGGLLTPRALAGFLVLGEQLVMWSAHLYATAMESFILARGLLRNLGEAAGPNLIDIDGVLVKVNNTNGEEGFERLDTGARWRYLARSKASGRGFTGDVNIIDEAFAYTEAQRAAMQPTTTARPNPQIVYASTPPLDRWSGEVMFGLRRRALAGDATDLGYRDWGDARDLDALMAMSEEKRAAILDDRDLWARTCPALGRGRVTEESIARLRRSLTDIDFARELGGMWPLPAEDAGGKIPPAVWAALVDEASQIVGRPVFAIEASRDRSTASILAAGRREDGLAHVELVDDRPGAGMAWVVDEAVELDRKHDPLAWMVDPAGPAGALIADLEARGLEVTTVTGREYTQACGEFLDRVMAGTARHLGQPPLDEAIRGARARDVGDGAWAWARKDSPVDVARVCGATLALHGLLVSAAAGPSLWL